MATTFPTTLDTFTNPNASDPLSSPAHHTQHTNANDAIAALEAKVGIASSSVVGSLDFRARLKYANTSVPGGNTVANTTTETAFTSAYTIPANALAAGDTVRVTLFGVYGTFAVAPNLTGKIKFGSTAMLNTGALTCIANLTNAGWKADALFVVQTIGAGGTIEAQGYAEFATAATTGLSVNVANTAAISVDTTASQAITVTVTWSAANAASTITLRQMVVEILKV